MCAGLYADLCDGCNGTEAGMPSTRPEGNVINSNSKIMTWV